MSAQRRECFEQFQRTCGCRVVLVTKDNLHHLVLPEAPLHPAYEYLSETHKADYLRTYLMHFYGGGYSDIKKTRGSWVKCFEDLRQSDAWLCGYQEYAGGVGWPPYAEFWSDLVGNGAYICKPGTPLTTHWYNEMIAVLDKKLPELRENPAKFPQDVKSETSNYPLGWTEILGQIFHRVCYDYKDRLLKTLPYSVFHGYR